MTLPIIDTVLSTISDGRTRDLRYRQRQLISLHQWIVDHIVELENSFRRDEHLSELEAQFLVSVILEELRKHYNALDLRAYLADEYSVKNGRNNPTASVPEDLVYILPQKFSLFYSVICALSASIAAGTCCIIELDNDSPHSASLIRQCLHESLDREAFKTTGTRLSDEILARCAIIDQASSLHKAIGKRKLTSQPQARAVAVVDRTADLDSAAQELLYSITFFSGRGPYAPSCILVNEFVKDNFLRLLDKRSSEHGRRNVDLIKTNGFAAVSQTATIVNGIHKRKALLEIGKSRLTEVYQRSDLKVDGPHQPDTIYLLATTSHDDAIDALSSLRRDDPLIASYVFAEPSAAKYLSQFIRARVSFINHIPANLLVGPTAPVEYPTSPGNRYSPRMLETPSPKFVTRISGEFNLREIVSKDSKVVEGLRKSALEPLRAMGQPKEGDGNFFVHGMLTGLVFLVLPLLTGTIVGASYAVTRLYRFWK